MGMNKHLDDPQFDVRKFVADLPILVRHFPWDINPPKLDPQEINFNQLPFALALQHQFAGHLSVEDSRKTSLQVLNAAIQQAEYQIDMLNAHVKSLNKQREKLQQETEKG